MQTYDADTDKDGLPDFGDRVLTVLPYYTLCTTPKEFEAVKRHLGIEDDDKWVSDGANGTTHTYTKGDMVTCVVCIEPADASDLDILGLIAHEATHVKQEFESTLLRNELSYEGEANAMQQIVQELWRIYMEGKRGKLTVDTVWC